jgi:hypothetical protein
LKKTGDDRISSLTLSEFIESKKLGIFGDYDVQKDPNFVKNKIQKKPFIE